MSVCLLHGTAQGSDKVHIASGKGPANYHLTRGQDRVSPRTTTLNSIVQNPSLCVPNIPSRFTILFIMPRSRSRRNCVKTQNPAPDMSRQMAAQTPDLGSDGASECFDSDTLLLTGSDLEQQPADDPMKGFHKSSLSYSC